MPDSTDREPMLPVTSDRPCKVCGKPDYCLYRADGKRSICGRVESRTRAGDAGYLHIHEDDPFPAGGSNGRHRRTATASAQAAATARPSRQLAPAHDWAADTIRYAANITADHKAHLAATFHIPVEALAAFPFTGVCEIVSSLPVFTFPEQTGGGVICGITKRYPRGTGPTIDGKQTDKPAFPGARRGLTVPAGWKDSPAAAPLFVVEGTSDTITLTAAGLAAIGRPGNDKGAADLIELLHDFPPGRPIVVVGENDRKATGDWPGMRGMKIVADHLARGLRRTVLTALPPDDAKDARDWFAHPARLGTPILERGRQFAAALLAAAVPVEESDDPAHWDRDPDNSHRLAREYLAHVTPPGEPARLRFWRGEFHEWSHGAYVTVDDKKMRARVGKWIDEEFQRVYLLEQAAFDRREGDTSATAKKPRIRNTTRILVSNVIGAIESLTELEPHQSADLPPVEVEPPAWVDGATGPNPKNLLSVRNGLVDVVTGRFLPATPSFFTFCVSPFRYDSDAPPPTVWLNMLAGLWPDDPESISTLQEMMGLLLTSETKYQKLFMLVGASRSGKGTILRVVRELVGERNIGATSLTSLSNDFGLSALIGKSVAVMPDVRVSSRTDTLPAIEKILAITGEDAVPVNRKNRDEVTARLGVRFVLASNELPRLHDTSEALFNRVILLQMNRSFLGNEDHDLESKVVAELPGILLWAMDGFRRLQARGRFVQPRTATEKLAELRDIISPVGAFVREWCRLKPGAKTECSEVYEAWKKWCEESGRKEPGTIQMFGRDLSAAFPNTSAKQVRLDGRQRRVFPNIEVLNEYERGNSTDDGTSESPNLPTVTEHPHTPPSVTRCNAIQSILMRIQNIDGGEESYIRAKMENTALHRVTEHSLANDGIENWMYVSGKLEVIYQPRGQTEPAVEFGGTKYYRLTPHLLGEIEKKGDEYAIAHPDDESLRRWADSMIPIYRFAEIAFPSSTSAADTPPASQGPRSTADADGIAVE